MLLGIVHRNTMKKIHALLLLMALTCSAAFAQELEQEQKTETKKVSEAKYGARAALNFSHFWGDDTEELHLPWGTGFNAGFAAKVGITPSIEIAPELSINMRNQSDDVTEWSTWAIEFPIMARFKMTDKLYVEIGPQIDFLLSSELESEFGFDESQKVDLGSSKIDALNTVEFDIAAGIGFEILPCLDADFRVVLGMTSMLNWDVEDEDDMHINDIKNLQIQIGATYWFAY